ncbi:hypothetical protein ACWENA_11085 [Streptomyces sp. NPDC004779]
MKSTPPSADDLQSALEVLLDFGCHLEEHVSISHLRPQLETVLHETWGLPAALGQILRAAARNIDGWVLMPAPREIREVIDRFREAAPEATLCLDLHEDVQRLDPELFDR